MSSPGRIRRQRLASSRMSSSASTTRPSARLLDRVHCQIIPTAGVSRCNPCLLAPGSRFDRRSRAGAGSCKNTNENATRSPSPQTIRGAASGRVAYEGILFPSELCPRRRNSRRSSRTAATRGRIPFSSLFATARLPRRQRPPTHPDRNSMQQI